ncbi:glucan phosphoethanolaminetransferase (alkaline phosphatase superfamily) [Rheinheimera pacifica]|uniref:hypothetical protein n=1 Tax=Rheinheimera pacifica TaxID=173990 RepID=UPI002169EAB4|nr:hypothetical protein [Rheinheimera pacifica]MCS4308874.1 glucan phosphoethanolaminetransferase (alkaline phosphatase superfamily) [Rheinheimera pacifica]
MSILVRLTNTPNLLLLMIGAGFIAPFFALVGLTSSISEYSGGQVFFYLFSSIFAIVSSGMLFLKMRFSRLCFLIAFALSCLPTLFEEYKHGLEGLIMMTCMMFFIFFILFVYLFKSKEVVKYLAN